MISRWVLAIALLLCLSTTLADEQSQKNSVQKIDYTDLISKLAVLVGLADQCGEQLNYYGKDALKAKTCKAFKTGFYKEWADRETLRDLLAQEFAAVEQGRRSCDEDCRVQLQRIEELRVTLTYYLDYIDFVAEG